MTMATLLGQLHVRLRLLCSCMALLLLGYAGIMHFMVQQAFKNHGEDETIFRVQRLDSTPHDPNYISQHLNERVLFFNRVPKAGSEMLVLLLQWLQGQNTFRHIRLKNSVNRFLSFGEQLELAAEIGQKVHDTTEPYVSFDRHLYFTNFTHLGLKMPIYLNLIRDPVEKLESSCGTLLTSARCGEAGEKKAVIGNLNNDIFGRLALLRYESRICNSRFYYARVTPRPGAPTPPGYRHPVLPKFATLEECILNKGRECTFLTGEKYDLSIPYFCGHHSYCRELNNEAALRAAKLHVEEWYPVVGVLEDINATLTVLEKKLPKYFSGVTDLYYNELLAPHHNKNRHRPQTSEVAKKELGQNFTTEYDFYNFVRQRLNLQFQQVNQT